MPVKTILLALASLACLGLAYRFGSHGVRDKDTFCIGLASAAVLVATVLGWLAIRSSAKQSN